MSLPSGDVFSLDDFTRRARERLSATPAEAHADNGGDFRLNDPPSQHIQAAARPAAVLAGIVAHPDEPTVLLTQRAKTLRSHAGQVSFPGGKVDPGETPLAAALREAREEIGLPAEAVRPLGWLNPYLTGTGFSILPLVALIEPGFALTLNAGEVDEAFETPLRFLMDEANHQIHERVWQGRARRFYAMPYGERYIWGATAGILRELFERLYSHVARRP